MRRASDQQPITRSVVDQIALAKDQSESERAVALAGMPQQRIATASRSRCDPAVNRTTWKAPQANDLLRPIHLDAGMQSAAPVNAPQITLAGVRRRRKTSDPTEYTQSVTGQQAVESAVADNQDAAAELLVSLPETNTLDSRFQLSLPG
jgi:hypothetical protein